MEETHDFPSGLYIIATPIGNMGDITLRALEVLGKVDAIACEDTRVAGHLAAVHGLTARRIAYHDHNAAEVRPLLIGMIREGKRVALISDAGMPLISDPGYKLVEACAAEDIYMTCLPGPTASLTALVLSGLPTDRFLFAGFLQPKSAARKAALAEIASVPATLVFYETGPRLAESLADMAEILGDRPAAVARELTKKFEEVRRDTLSALAAHYDAGGETRGEIVVVVGAPSGDEGRWTEDAVDEALRQAIAEGMSVKDAAALISARSGLKKRDVYQRALVLAGK